MLKPNLVNSSAIQSKSKFQFFIEIYVEKLKISVLHHNICRKTLETHKSKNTKKQKPDKENTFIILIEIQQIE